MLNGMFSKQSKQIINSEFYSNFVFHTYGLVPN